MPRGDPPAGRQLVADRTTMVGGMVRANGDGVARVLILRPAQDALPSPYQQRRDLYVVAAGPDTPPVEQLLATDVQQFSGGTCGLVRAYGFCSDARGRLLVLTNFDPTLGFTKLARINPVTGDRLDLGVASYYILSPSGERFIYTGAPTLDVTLVEPDDRVVPLGSVGSTVFVGEVLYYTTQQLELMRIVPGGTPERLATGVGFFASATTEGNRLLVLARTTADPTVNTFSIFDTATLEETAAPPGVSRFELSPDGRWILTFDTATGRGAFIERATGVQDAFEIPGYQGGSYEWRPGHDEIWFPDGSYSDAKVWIKKPGQPAIMVSAMAISLPNEQGGISIFTGDGAYWFSMRGMIDFRPIMQVGSADDPAGERFDLLPLGTFASEYWQLADGRILAPGAPGGAGRTDIYVVDPTTGASRALGEAGFPLAVGETRLLTNLRINEGRGDLTVIELATGRATVLASEFALGAAVERVGADAVAPGAQVAFQFQARFESPFDGIWLTTIP
jgi:hypothetical protein